ncbi:response regulator [Pararhizobium mangrovi]|uniref:Response regulator transcription factor n=1 Tax=Pararhizobium mangrovi TaxID=2590452 RepID=A0A506U886_9HYPH|nr:response regulator transcription factor [Pararhizobium mangrovi]TPW29321.1 response regulator transcription factor [Pararhizobium mangrovi]
MRILLVEDDRVLGDGLRTGLTLEGHTVDWLEDGEDAAIAVDRERFDVAILDLALPSRSGMDVLADWRSRENSLPVLVLTATGDNAQCIAALDTGADDYVVKPAELDQILARLRALQRRAAGKADNRMSCGALHLERENRMAWLADEPLDLSAYEFAILETLMEHPGRPVSPERLESLLYGWNAMPESNSVQVLIHKLRSKIGTKRIETLRGLGYRLST